MPDRVGCQSLQALQHKHPGLCDCGRRGKRTDAEERWQFCRNVEQDYTHCVWYGRARIAACVWHCVGEIKVTLSRQELGVKQEKERGLSWKECSSGWNTGSVRWQHLDGVDSRCFVADVQGLKDLQDGPGVTPKPRTSPGSSHPSSSWKQVVWGFPEQWSAPKVWVVQDASESGWIVGLSYSSRTGS